MTGTLSGRTALVTGGTRGIGFAVARALGCQGAAVAITARSRDELAAAKTSLMEAGAPRVATAAADLTVPDQVVGMVESVVHETGPLNILVNVAGPPMRGGPFAEIPDDAWADTFLTKLMGAVRVTRAALAHLATDGTGRVINIAGMSANTVVPNAAPTAVTNAAIIALTKYLSAELAAANVRVTAVSPGMTQTEGWMKRAEQAGVSGEQFMGRFVEALSIPLKRWAQPDEIANVVAFLASDASSYMTGQTLIVDGGTVRNVT